MALVTRTINNTNQPIYDESGNPVVGVKVRFTLINSDDYPTDAWDTTSLQRVLPNPIIATTDSSGQFSVNLWPNDRGDIQTYYRFDVLSPNVRPCLIFVPSGDLSTITIESLAIFTSSTVPADGILTDAGYTLFSDSGNTIVSDQGD